MTEYVDQCQCRGCKDTRSNILKMGVSRLSLEEFITFCKGLGITQSEEKLNKRYEQIKREMKA